jgi:putative NADPH-quinone reductase
MNGCRILLLEGHPDAEGLHLSHALADAYALGAELAGHEVRRVQVAKLDFPLLRSQQDWAHGEVPAALEQVQTDIAWAQHLVLFFPLWLGDMPAMLKGFLEQVVRPDFAFRSEGGRPTNPKGLQGRSARVVVTMGRPSGLYGWYLRVFGISSLEHNILRFVGIAPVRQTLIGLADRLGVEGALKWASKLHKLGASAA